MGFYDIVTSLCKKHHISVRNLERELGFSNNSIGYARKGGMPSSERIQKIADYFHVPVDYLLTGTMPESSSFSYSTPETRDLAQFLFENPAYSDLFEAAKEVKPEDIELVLRMIKGVNQTREEK